MTNNKSLYGFSETHPDMMHDAEMREQKAIKMLFILNDYYSGKLEAFSLLDIGCSTGIITNRLNKKFSKVVRFDIDKEAIKYAQKNFRSDNLQFSIQDSMNIGFPDKSFDVVVCAHIYEHVPESRQLLSGNIQDS